MTKQELEARGVNFDNTIPFGEMNIIVQQMPVRKNELEEGQLFAAYPDVYHPRNNSVYSCGETLKGYLLETELDRKMYISKLKDSSERLKIMSILLAQQAKELEENGEILTMLYYPEETE